VVFHRLNPSFDYGGSLHAQWTLFDNCKFYVRAYNKGQFPIKMRFHNCIFHRCDFEHWSDTVCGVEFHNCAFINLVLPDIDHEVRKDFDCMDRTHREWHQFGGCTFLNCEIPPSVVWYSAACNYLNCRFLTGGPFEAKHELTVYACMKDCTGTPPSGSAAQKITIVQPAEPYLPPALPICAFSEIEPKARKIADLGKGYRWISQKATYTLSSADQNEKLSAKLLNGEGGWGRSDSFSFQTSMEDSPSMVIDLGRRRAVAALELENSWVEMGRAKTLTAWISDRGNGPWVEVWSAKEAQSQWCVQLEHSYPCRFIKLGLKEKSILHLNQVKIFER